MTLHSRFVTCWLWATIHHRRHNMSLCMTRPVKWSVHPAKTQISLGICPVWLQSAVRIKKPWVLSFLMREQWRFWSECVDAQADLSFRWAHMSFCWFCHAAAHLTFSLLQVLWKHPYLLGSAAVPLLMNHSQGIISQQYWASQACRRMLLHLRTWEWRR